MEFNIKNVLYSTIDGKDIKVPNVGKAIGSFIYERTTKLSLAIMAQALYKEEPFTVTEEEISELQQVIENENCTVSVLVKLGLISYIKSLLDDQARTSTE